ncbi:hypothetical protein [Microlunatus parietis]|uniref:Uncharacterized protein n=1 Tax=Microlunatus parietis TaxID=682979 RepID=A0A7Y9IBD3_9ACTN|nr:hypothetical protein [Microlunatus parietis]NYE73585.1 hypothetical protein [Microlunatus parietis]
MKIKIGLTVADQRRALNVISAYLREDGPAMQAALQDALTADRAGELLLSVPHVLKQAFPEMGGREFAVWLKQSTLAAVRAEHDHEPGDAA